MMASRSFSARRGLLIAAAAFGLCQGVHAASVEIAGNVSLSVNAANAAGGHLATDTDHITYDVSNAAGTKKLLGRLNQDMPVGTTLAAQLASPPGATAQGSVTLTASDQTLVTGIGVGSYGGLDLAFTLTATVQAARVTAATRTFILTIVDAP